MKKKRQKRKISLLVAVLLLGNIGVLGGCSGNDKEYMTAGEWIDTINREFGMFDYKEQTPYFPNITPEDPYFAAVQIAAEWDVISAEDGLDTEEFVTEEFAANTLVNVADLDGTTIADITNESELKYPEKVRTALANGLTELEENGEFLKDERLEKTDAVMRIKAAKELWANMEYAEDKFEYDLAEDVIDFTQADGFSYGFDAGTNTVTLSEEYGEQLKAGDKYILPGNENSEWGAFEVTDIEKNGNEYILYNEIVDSNQIFENYELETTYIPDFSMAVIKDGNGNVVYDGTNRRLNVNGVVNKENRELELKNLAYKKTNAAKAISTGLFNSVNLKFDVGTLEVDATFSGNSISLGIEGALDSGKLYKFNQSHGYEDFKITADCDVKGFSVKSAQLKLDYKEKESFSIAREWKAAPVNPDVNNLWANIKSAFTSDLTDANAKVDKEIPLFEIYQPSSIPFVDFVFEGKMEISVEGAVSIDITTNHVKGIEYKNKNLRLINETNKDHDEKLSGKIEVVAPFTAGISVFRQKVLDIGIEAGAGVEAEAVFHVLDKNRSLEGSYTLGGPVDLAYKYQQSGRVDVCGNLKLYGILKIVGATDDTLVGRAIGASLSFEIFGPDNAVWLETHFEDWNFMKECTRSYEGKKEEDEKEEDEEEGQISLSTYNVILYKNGSERIQIEKLPEGYKTSDFYWESADQSVATVKEGIISAVGKGETIISVHSRNGNYHAECSVIVSDEEEVEFTPLL